MRQAGDDPTSLATCDAPQAPLTHLLGTIATLSRMVRDHQLAELKLVGGQDRLLDTLSDGEAISVSLLAQAMHVRPSTVSKTLDRMCTRGLCRRESNIGDQRLTMVRLTPEGVQLQAQVRQAYAESEAKLTRFLDGGVSEALRAELNRVQDALLRQASKVR